MSILVHSRIPGKQDSAFCFALPANVHLADVLESIRIIDGFSMLFNPLVKPIMVRARPRYVMPIVPTFGIALVGYAVKPDIIFVFRFALVEFVHLYARILALLGHESPKVAPKSHNATFFLRSDTTPSLDNSNNNLASALLAMIGMALLSMRESFRDKADSSAIHSLIPLIGRNAAPLVKASRTWPKDHLDDTALGMRHLVDRIFIVRAREFLERVPPGHFLPLLS